MRRYYEEHLPENYIEAYHIDAKNAKIGTTMNIIALFITALFVGAGSLVRKFAVDLPAAVEHANVPAACGIFTVSIFIYMILHELVHGAVYKSLTRKKLTFGLSWSCAFCGVPNIYVTRLTALLALLAPFVVFTILFTAFTVGLLFVHPIYFYFSCILLGIHVGGCVGDLYMTALLLFKYKASSALIRDTGPEQFIYIEETAPPAPSANEEAL